MSIEGAMADGGSRPIRERIVRGAAGQGMAIASRIVVQLGMAGVLLPAWGLQLYGEWLTIVGVALFAGASDLGFLSAASSDIAISVGRGDREHALNTFRTVGNGVAVTFVIGMSVVLVGGTWAPLDRWLGLEQIGETDATAILAMIAAQSMCVMACMLLAAGYASEGHYGEAFGILSTVYLLEWVAAAVAALAGQGPLIATAVLLAVRVIGMIAMYVYLRRLVPWLSFGRPSGKAHVRKRLTAPALAGAAIGWGTALSMQAMIVLVGVVAGAASAAIFATVRAVSRIVIQLATSIGPVAGPELARAFGGGDQALLRVLQRRVTQLGFWSAVAMVAVLALIGDWLVSVVTRGTVVVPGPLLLILLVGAVFEVAWTTSGQILFATNRHMRVGVIYTVLSAAGLGLAYVLVSRWGADGAAWSVLAVSVAMVVVMLPASLRATDDSIGAWARTIFNPRELPRAIAAIRPRA
jgi:O-antigen/teichoic acid export membrane protein